MKIGLREDVDEGPAREVAPGVILHYGRSADGAPTGELLSIEVEPRAGRDLQRLAFERFDERGEVTSRVPADPEETVRHVREALRHLETAGVVTAERAQAFRAEQVAGRRDQG